MSTFEHPFDSPPDGTLEFERRRSSVPPAGAQKRVLIVQPEEQTWVDAALGETYEISNAVDGQTALALADGIRPHLVIANAQMCNRQFLDGLTAPTLGAHVLFIADDGAFGPIINALANNHTFSVFSGWQNAELLRSHVHRVLFPRLRDRHEITSLTAEISTTGLPRSRYQLKDVSNRGCAVELKPSDVKRSLLPGAWLQNIRILQGNRVIMDRVSAVVRYLSPVVDVDNEDTQQSAPKLYRVGLEFAQEEPDALVKNVIRDRLELLAALREASRFTKSVNSGFRAERADDATVTWKCSLESITWESDRVVMLTPDRADFQVGDVVKMYVEVAGNGLEFLTSIVDIDPNPTVEGQIFEIKVPRAATAVRRRMSNRYRPDEDQPVSIRVVSPFGTGVLQVDVLDITSSGVSFPISQEKDLFPVGTSLEDFVLCFPSGKEIAVQGQVRSISGGHGPTAPLARCGVEFVAVSASDRRAIRDEILNSMHASVRDGSDQPFEKIWDFLMDTGFLYPEKLEKMDVPAVTKTMTTLLRRPNDLFKTWLYWKDGEIRGHLSTVRTTEHTWNVQHLATDLGMTSAKSLNMVTAQFIEQNPEVHWWRIFFKPDNPWPARIFGSFASRGREDSRRLMVRTYHYAACSTNVGLEPNSLGFEIHEASASDVPDIEACFLERKRVLELDVLDISPAGLNLTHLDARYRELGLERRREIIIARKDGAFRGVALLDISSPGLNFSELTNSFMVLVTNDDSKAATALALAARERYRVLGYPLAVCLSEDADVPSIKRAGFRVTKQYTCMNVHRTLIGRYYGYAARKFS